MPKYNASALQILNQLDELAHHLLEGADSNDQIRELYKAVWDRLEFEEEIPGPVFLSIDLQAFKIIEALYVEVNSLSQRLQRPLRSLIRNHIECRMTQLSEGDVVACSPQERAMTPDLIEGLPEDLVSFLKLAKVRNSIFSKPLTRIEGAYKVYQLCKEERAITFLYRVLFKSLMSWQRHLFKEAFQDFHELFSFEEEAKVSRKLSNRVDQSILFCEQDGIHSVRWQRELYSRLTDEQRKIFAKEQYYPIQAAFFTFEENSTLSMMQKQKIDKIFSEGGSLNQIYSRIYSCPALNLDDAERTLFQLHMRPVVKDFALNDSNMILVERPRPVRGTYRTVPERNRVIAHSLPPLVSQSSSLSEEGASFEEKKRLFSEDESSSSYSLMSSDIESSIDSAESVEISEQSSKRLKIEESSDGEEPVRLPGHYKLLKMHFWSSYYSSEQSKVLKEEINEILKETTSRITESDQPDAFQDSLDKLKMRFKQQIKMNERADLVALKKDARDLLEEMEAHKALPVCN